ncbi:MAG: phospho-N-acetylmuramoyl-pentapeptide-transferase [Lachnospiraceae bacterium]|nr:phospho-N-acetylmuramoyl-pentapeptide-transferase [Lachnospiraceae bacterium]
MAMSVVVSIIAAFVISALSGLVVLPFLRRLHAAQTEREDGPATHLKKTGTPTMGGFIFLIGFLVVSTFYSITNRAIIPVIIATMGFGFVGFLDDYIKVVKKRSLGLKAWQKIVLQLLVTAALLWYIASFTSVSFDMAVPFSAMFSPDGNSIYVNFGFFTIPFLVLVILGTVNGANLTDGLDGLLGSVTTVVALFIVAASLKLGIHIAPAGGAMAGALIGFLLYNWHPAKVFMGDTGSLALGGFVVSSMIMMKMSIFIIIVCFVYFAESLSDIIQVLYFKATGGKRFFRMAPLHHHFELGGWSEIRVVRVFVLVTVFLCVLSFWIL